MAAAAGSRCEAWVQPTLVLGPFGAPRFTLPFAVPATPALDGACVPVQVWWLPPTLPIAIRTSNALLLGIGS